MSKRCLLNIFFSTGSSKNVSLNAILILLFFSPFPFNIEQNSVWWQALFWISLFIWQLENHPTKSITRTRRRHSLNYAKIENRLGLSPIVFLIDRNWSRKKKNNIGVRRKTPIDKNVYSQIKRILISLSRNKQNPTFINKLSKDTFCTICKQRCFDILLSSVCSPKNKGGSRHRGCCMLRYLLP